MDYILLKEFFADYSLPVLIIALVIGVVKFFVDKFLVKNINRVFLSYAPFILCVVLYIAYDMLFVLKSFALTYQSLYAGLLSGSLSVIFCSMIKKISSGKVIASQTVMLIEGILQGVVSDNLLTQTAIELERLLASDFDDNSMRYQLTIALKNSAPEDYTEDQLMHVASLVMQAVKTIKTA